ncbi:MAG TPA: FecR domain-containing protein [Candidatus Hydrogenedens sp.]|nr:FecR domain-containing protein [Candidatus Hydrogenedens sp.]
MARCSQIELEMQAYLDGELSRAKELIIEEHLSTCEHCKVEFELLRKSNALLYESLNLYKLNESLEEQIMKGLPKVESIDSQTTHQINLRIKNQDENHYSFADLFTYLAIAAMIILGIFILMRWPYHKIIDTNEIGVAINISGESSVIDSNVNEQMKEGVPTYLKSNNYIETQKDSLVFLYLKANSTIKLADNTRIRILDERTTNIEKGKVWFDIGKNKKVFRVNIPQGVVTVFGTQFQIEVDSTQCITTVSRGEVTVEAANQFVVLKADQQVQFNNDGFISGIKNCDSKIITAWANEIKPSDQMILNNILTNSASTQPISISTPASQVFIVPIQNKQISSLVLRWDKQKIIEKSNFTIYASDDDLKPLFKYKITNEWMLSLNGEITIPIPHDVSLKQVKILHIEIVSDDLEDLSSMPFREIYGKN